ncbi:GAF domain-containing protein [Bacillus sp. Marseille-P3661]|uniref:GAF domain-containing protein n=1 Tax=Bacillus sp. Marseille-P3661 TaxID=1936234 RepID=UPI000C85FE9F|nr:GAF domain-containing protein [Bacillus sp. Marseille-P3661]
MQRTDVVVYMKEYATNKKVKDLLKKINPRLAKKENNIRVHLSALLNNVITEEEYLVIETKMMLGKLCLDLESLIPDSFVTVLFYNYNENKIYHGAAPSIPADFFNFFHDINYSNAFNENCGSCGNAVYQQKVVVTDIETSYLWEPLRDYVMGWGFQTGWSVPFFRDKDVFGTFAIYHKYNKQVTEEEIQLVQQKVAQYQVETLCMINKLTEKKA